MKKLLTFFLTALLAFTVGWAETATFEVTSTGGGLLSGISKTNYEVTTNGVTLTFDIGTHTNTWPTYYSSDGMVRFYTGNTLTVSCGNGNITSIVFTYGSSYTSKQLSLANNQPGTYNTTNYTWTGSSSSVQFTNTGANTRFYRVVVTWETGGSTVETCATPTFSPAAGTYNEAQDVTISTTTSGASIYYTTDNSTPSSTNGTLYTGAINVSETTTIKAIAVKTGNNDSQVAEATYTIETGGDSGSTIYRKVTSTDALTTGDYLIVYEDGSLVFDGSLTTLDAVNNTQAVTIDNHTITTSLPIYFTYNATAHTLKSASGYYMGRTSNSNGMNTSQTEAYTNTITFDGSGNAVITSSGGPTLRYNSASNQTRFRYYGSGQQAIQLYKKDSNDPTLLATPTTLTLTDIPYDGSSTSGTIHVDGTYLTDDVTVSVSGADFSVSPTTISPADGNVDENITVTYSGSSTTEVTATVTITCGNLTQTVTVTAKKATPPAASITVNPSTLTINDTDNTLTITGENITGNINASLANNTDWYLTSNQFSNTGGTTNVVYNGRDLSATNTVSVSANDVQTIDVPVNYLADLYIVTDNGYTGQWNFNNGTSMTYNNGVYTASFTAERANTYILFARKLGNGVDWNTRFVFGPDSGGDWWLPIDGNGSGNIDLYDDDPIKIQTAGTYIITIDATGSPVTFTITKEVVIEGDFVLVTDDSQLNTGDEVIFVNKDTHGDWLAMSTTQNSNNRGTTDVTVSPTLKVTATDETQIATLEGDATGWYFNVGNGYLYAASNNSNYLRTRTERGDDNAKARITINNNVASIVFQGTNSHNVMQFNGTLVSCYGSANQSPVYLYRREASAPEPSITVNPSSLDLVIPVGESSVSGNVTVTETNTTGTTSVAVSGTGANYFSATLENGTLTVTYNGNATMTSPDVATITLTNGDATATVNVTGYKRVEATGTLYSKVTNANQIQNGLQYILVYEDTPEALNGITTGGTGAEVSWEEQGSIINISGTDVIEFTLNGNANGFTLSSDHGYLNPSAPGLAFDEEDGTAWSAESNNGGYVLKWGNYMMRYNSGASAANGRFRIYDGTTGTPVYLYVQGSAVATPVITPASGNYAEDQEVTITCATTGATIYYTVNGGETQTYDGPFTVDVDEDHTTTTIAAWAEDGEQHHSPTVTVTYTYKKDHVSSIAEFLALDNGEEVIFDNPVVVLFDYSQNSGGGQEYIWIKDRTDYTQLFITPQFDAASVADPQYDNYGQFVPKYENGDVIPAGFKVKKNYYGTGQYVQAMCTDTHNTFQIAEDKALADPEQVTLSELLANPANYNNRYLYINKLQVSNVNGLNFDISADENGDDVSEVQGGTSIVGYNKYNSPAWKNKQGQTVGVTLPTNSNYYNVKFIFQKWDNGYEIMPIEFTPWEETSLRLEDLVQVGVEGQPYTISNQLHAVEVTWDNNRGKFAIFAKDDHMYANKSYPTADQESYLIRYENGNFINEVEQEDYDQSNWIEILIPSEITQKNPNIDNYQPTLESLKETFENKILAAGSITGTYVDALNPTIEVTTRPTPGSASTYTPNIYCTANFPKYNFENGGAQGNDGIYFMMAPKPHEFCKVVWAYYGGSGNYFIAPQREGDEINGHDFKGSFLANMSLCEDIDVVYEDVAPYFSNSTDAGLLYGFNAIVRKTEASQNQANGAPHRIQPSDSGTETNPAYVVYPLNRSTTSSDNVVDVKELLGGKTIESIHYFNTMGMEGKTPFEGINIVVTRYTDGSTSTYKVMK
jgi:hypothetical protein